MSRSCLRRLLPAAFILLAGCRTVTLGFVQWDCTDVDHWEILQSPATDLLTLQSIGTIAPSNLPNGICEDGIVEVATAAIADDPVVIYLRAVAADGTASDLSNGLGS